VSIVVARRHDVNDGFAALDFVEDCGSWRSCNWLEGSPERRLNIRPRFTASR
jgi:hypothetical protein